MLGIRQQREAMGLSQRALAQKAGLSFRTIQLLEGKSNTTLATLEAVALALGYEEGAVERKLASLYGAPPESVVAISEHLSDANWKLVLFGFVDAYRRHPDPRMVCAAPQCTGRLEALLGSVVEALADEAGQAWPVWTERIAPLRRPWFVSGIENLKASALLESPIHFRKRKIFVLSNFLSRA